MSCETVDEHFLPPLCRPGETLRTLVVHYVASCSSISHVSPVLPRTNASLPLSVGQVGSVSQPQANRTGRCRSCRCAAILNWSWSTVSSAFDRNFLSNLLVRACGADPQCGFCVCFSGQTLETKPHPQNVSATYFQRAALLNRQDSQWTEGKLMEGIQWERCLGILWRKELMWPTIWQRLSSSQFTRQVTTAW